MSTASTSLRAIRLPGIRVWALSASLSLLGGCMAAGVSPVTGFVYTNVKGPVTATQNDTRPTKVGRASARSIMGWWAMGDASIDTAAKNGGISKIHHVDFETQTVLGVIADFTVVVYGD